jgi:uncharacterized membrane protein YhaH (DUF805 family)
MNLVQSFISVFKNWNNFSGRACRSEYWFFYLSIFLITIVLTIVELLLGVFDEVTGFGPLTALFQIIIIIPNFYFTDASSKRR